MIRFFSNRAEYVIDEQIVGYVTFGGNPQTHMSISTVYVQPAYRRHGIATALIRAVLQRYDPDVIWHAFIVAEISPNALSQTELERLFLRFGFQIQSGYMARAFR